ncbi:MAG: hypothetical protein A3J28_10360 [Acidobacteria bacterium RIFCSPLOWO2_12_FULL_60_22]|nr:MAG: hypothetical protein A3J28_10360 [Acidobacteria bacterium RIFCSPLOWO2_12_FULL_60_22]
MPLGRAILFVLILHWVTTASYAEQIEGRVTNAQGASVSGAKVTAVHRDNSLRREATTGSDGTYAIGGLEPGVYTVTLLGVSGQATLRRQVTLGSGASSVRANFQLPAAAAPNVAGAEERNPNIFIYRIDLNDLRNRLTTARGPDPQYLPELKPEQNYFGSEFGTPLLAFETIRPRPLLRSWRGSLSGFHQNSALNARNFFNVGPLRASRSTNYGITGEGPLQSQKTSLLLSFGQTFTSGFVNGNVQAPLASERTPLASDPQVNAIIRNALRAFPADLPNLPYVSLRQLNTNALRDIEATNGLARLDLKLNDSTSGAFRYFLDEYSETPFQIILGQNPRTDLRFQGLYSNLTHSFSSQATGRFGFHYDRVRVDLGPTKQYEDLLAPLGLKTAPDLVWKAGSLGLSASLGLGPGKQFPRRRVQNRFQFYADGSKTAGRHSLTAGWGIARLQVNDLQSDNLRGLLSFSSDFGNDEVTNFLLGRSTQLTLTLGNLYRGFRNWEHSFYWGDQIRVSPTLSFSLGVRYELMTAPSEVNHLTAVGFPTDKNNFAPRFGFAWNPRRGKTAIRGTYGISYGTFMPVSYGMTRFNPPAVQVLQIQIPDLRNLVNLLAVANQPPAPGGRSSLFQLSPDLIFPYSHQYSFGIERELPWATQLRVAYIGMRSFHLLTQGMYNRAADVPGLVATTANINDRRPDPRSFDINVIESNSIAYYDAVQVGVNKRLSRGLSVRAAYTFGKNIDTGGDFTNTGSGLEVPPENGTSVCERCDRVADLKSWSSFDTPQVLALTFLYDLPSFTTRNGWMPALVKGWQISGTTIFQSGIPYHLHTGSDGPGIGNVDGNTSDRPNILNPSLLGKSIDNPDTAPSILRREYFDTNIPVGGRGNIGYNVLRKDGTNNWNFAVGRTFRLPGGGERSLQFRAEFYNFLNHPQFDKAGYQFSSETFGKITNTVNKGRQVQFALRLNF